MFSSVGVLKSHVSVISLLCCRNDTQLEKTAVMMRFNSGGGGAERGVFSVYKLKRKLLVDLCHSMGHFTG